MTIEAKEKFTAQDMHSGCRLDSVLSEYLGISRNRAARMIGEGEVLSSTGKTVKASLKLESGDVIYYSSPDPASTGPQSAVPETINLNIVFEDEQLLVIDKPVGMVVHPAPGHRKGTLVNAVLGHLGEDKIDSRLGGTRPGIVHRLDKDTSGLIVVAKTLDAHTGLAEQIRERKAKRVYRCLSWGHWPERTGKIIGNIDRNPKNRKKMALVDDDKGRYAETDYKVLESFEMVEYVEVSLRTGRTHQIRVHFSAHGHPVFGDPEYGGRKKAVSGMAHNPERQLLAARMLNTCNRQALHAARLSFNHPFSGEKLEFNSPLPRDMNELLEILREKQAK